MMNYQELSVEELKQLHETATDRKAEEQKMIDEINSEMVRRYNVDTDHIGTRTFDDAKFNVPKNVKWDQDEIKKAIKVVEGWEEPVEDYVKITYEVAESKWNAWPETVRKVFTDARSVKPGKVKVEFK